MKEGKNFSKREGAFFSVPQESSAERGRENPCRLYAAEDYARYIEKNMSSERAIEFEVHAHECPICQKGLAIEQEQRENAVLLKKTYDLLDNLDKTPKFPPPVTGEGEGGGEKY